MPMLRTITWLLAFVLLMPFFASAAEAPVSSLPTTLPSGIVKILRTTGDYRDKPYLVIGDHLVTLTAGPELEVLDLVTLETLATVSQEIVPNWLCIVGDTIRNYDSEQGALLLRLDREPPVDLSPYDFRAFGKYADRQGIPCPREAGYAYVWKNRCFRFSQGPTIVCFEEGQDREYPRNLKLAGGNYEVCFNGPYPIGFNKRFIVRLDDHLCATARLLEIPDDQFAPSHVATDGRTIALLRGQLVEIWQPDGIRPAASLNVGLVTTPRDSSQVIAPFAGGYLIAGKTLAWLHPSGQQWTAPTVAPPPPSRSRNVTFSTITLTHHRIIMSDDSGVIYIIDPSIVLGRKVPPPSYEGGPKPLVQMLRRASTQPR